MSDLESICSVINKALRPEVLARMNGDELVIEHGGKTIWFSRELKVSGEASMPTEDLQSTLTATQEALRQSEAAGAEMRKLIQHEYDKGASFAKTTEEHGLDNWRAECLRTHAGKSLLAELDQCKERLEEAEWLIDEARHAVRTERWFKRCDKWLAERKVKE